MNEVVSNQMERSSQKPELVFIGKALEEVKEIKKQLRDNLSHNTFFDGVGIGIAKNENSCQFELRVYLSQELSEQQIETLPHELDSVPVSYITTGEINVRKS